MLRVLVTRPEPRGTELAGRLRNLGHQVECIPLLEIVPVEIPVGGMSASIQRSPYLCLTSRSVIVALSAWKGEAPDLIEKILALRCFCVGEQTAADARAFGFTDVIASRGGGEALAELLMEYEQRPVCHLCGKPAKDEPAYSLKRSGWDIVSFPVYESKRIVPPLPDLTRCLEEKSIDVALFYSARTANHFCDLVRLQSLEACCQSLTAIGLSQAIKEVLEDLPWRHVLAATEPTDDAMVEALSMCYPSC